MHVLLAVAFGTFLSAAADTPAVSVVVDPRIELLSVVQYFSDYIGMDGAPVQTRLDFPYKAAVVERFSSHKDHPAVRLFDEMSAAGFWYGQPPEAMLSYSAPPDLRVISPVAPFIVERAGGREKLDAFIAALRDFAVETDFMAFFRAHEDDYARMVADFTGSVRVADCVADLEAFYGYPQHGYTVIVAPFLHPGGFGPRIAAGGGRYDVYYIAGPWAYRDGAFSFGDEPQFRRMVWHEFSHSYVNHLAEAYLDRLTGPADLLNPGMKERIAGMPGITFDLFAHEWASEHIVRAVTTRLAYDRLGEAEGDLALIREEKAGYAHVKRLCDELARYTAGRETYRTFDDFFPELVAVFEGLAAE